MKLTRFMFSTFLILILFLTACNQNEKLTNDLPAKAAVATSAPQTDTPTADSQATGGDGTQTENNEDEVEPTNEVNRPFASPEYGMQAFMWWRPEVADRDLNLLIDAGFQWMKQDFAWREIEGAGKGIFDWSHSDIIVEMTHDRFGAKIIARVDRQPGWATGGECTDGSEMGPPQNLQDYADFLAAFATRYKGKIGAYAIWNEPNLAREWCNRSPNPVEYAKLLKLAYSTIKEIDPDAIIISAGLSPTGGPMPIAMEDTEFLEKLYEAAGGSLDGYADVVGAHAPGFKAPPEISPDEVMQNTEMYGDGRYFTFRRVEDLRVVMEKRNDLDRQIAILEMGWTTDTRADSPYHWHAVTEEEKADYLVRAFAFAEKNWSPWIGVMTVIYLCNTDWTDEDEQFYWCITHPDYPNTITYPAYEALKAMPKKLE